MIAMDFETQLIERALHPPSVTAMFYLPPFREIPGKSHKQSVRMRKKYNKARRVMARLVRSIRKNRVLGAWANPYTFAFALNLSTALCIPHYRHFTPNETGRSAMELGTQIHNQLEDQFREDT